MNSNPATIMTDPVMADATYIEPLNVERPDALLPNLGGQGGGFCYNVEELRTIVANGLDLSMTHQCLIEESILGVPRLPCTRRNPRFR